MASPSNSSQNGGILGVSNKTSFGRCTVTTTTSTGCITLQPGTRVVSAMIVAGGGGSGTGHPSSGVGGGGSGGGGMILIPEISASGCAPVVIGSGGSAGSIGSTDGGTGNDTTAFSLTAKGGGGGATRLSPAPGATGGSGGSGGGATYNCSPSTVPESTATQPIQPGDSGTFGFGNVGGGYPAPLAGGPNATGGGGGAGTARWTSTTSSFRFR